MKALAREGARVGARFVSSRMGSGLGLRRKAGARPWG
jgi:hypothetical protein